MLQSSWATYPASAPGQWHVVVPEFLVLLSSDSPAIVEAEAHPWMARQKFGKTFMLQRTENKLQDLGFPWRKIGSVGYTVSRIDAANLY